MWPFNRKKYKVIQQTEMLVHHWYFNFDNMSARLNPDEPGFHDMMITAHLLTVDNYNVGRLEVNGVRNFFSDGDRQRALNAAYQSWIDKKFEQEVGLTFEDEGN
jgi:hypothetical protein